MNYTNPRLHAEIDGWPYGSLRTTAFFDIERSPRGERAVRVTINPKTGGKSAPKSLTYGLRQRIVDGDDGKTYILSLSIYGNISVMQSNMQYQQESVYPEDARYAAMRELLNQAGG